MATIQNLRPWQLILASGHVVPARETLETSNEVLRLIDNAIRWPALIAAGDAVVTYDPDPEPDEPAADVSAPTPKPVKGA